MKDGELLLIEELLAFHRERLEILGSSKKSQRSAQALFIIDEKIRKINQKLRELYGYSRIPNM